MKFTLYLNAQGDEFSSFTYCDNAKQESRAVTDEDEIHPVLKKVLAPKTKGYEAILSVLKEIKAKGKAIKNLKLYHLSSRYEGHECQKGAAHEDTVDSLISFVEERIKNKANYEAGYNYQVSSWGLAAFKNWLKLDTSNRDVQAGREDVKNKHHNRYVHNI